MSNPTSAAPITIWYRMDDNKVYQHNHLEDGYDPARKSPTPKVEEHKKMWKNGKWAMQYAVLVQRGYGVPALVTEKGELIPV